MMTMRFAVLAAALLVAACASGGGETDRTTGHFGAGMHAGRVAGR